MGAQMSFIANWYISSDISCQVAANQGISGLFGRIGFSIVPNSCIILLLLDLILSFQEQTESIKTLREKLKEAFSEATSFQLVMADAYVITALISQSYTSWFHFRFLNDAVILSCLSAALLSLQVRRTRRAFVLHLVNATIFIALLLWSGIVYLIKVSEALQQRPGCYDKRFESFCKPFDIGLGVGVILLLFIPACIPGTVKIHPIVLGFFSTLASLAITALTYLSFTDYEVMKVMLASPETGPDSGQTLTLLTSLLTLPFVIYNKFGPRKVEENSMGSPV